MASGLANEKQLVQFINANVCSCCDALVDCSGEMSGDAARVALSEFSELKELRPFHKEIVF